MMVDARLLGAGSSGLRPIMMTCGDLGLSFECINDKVCGRNVDLVKSSLDQRPFMNGICVNDIALSRYGANRCGDVVQHSPHHQSIKGIGHIEHGHIGGHRELPSISVYHMPFWSRLTL